MEKWLPVSQLLVTYVAGPYPSAEQCTRLKSWLEAGGHWLALHGTCGGRAERVEGLSQRRAKSVAAFLTASGVEAGRINAIGLGEKNPRSPNPYDPANRRVEMRIKTQ